MNSVKSKSGGRKSSTNQLLGSKSLEFYKDNNERSKNRKFELAKNEPDEAEILIVDDDMFGLTTLQTMIKITFELSSLTCSNG